jgi:5-methylcytosine-specific restriction enzyme subunit McrC
MLSLTKNLPLEERDLADQKLRRLPLLEMMIRIFLKRLLTELRRGRDQSYLYRQENLPILKGKLLTTQHLRLNLARHDRFYVGYDEFVADTLLNRILKSACRRLLGVSTNAANQQLAREAILDLADVDDVKIERGDFERVQLTRSSERFRVLVSFSELVLTDRSPEPSVGGRSTFSLLFPMEKLFEEFVGEFIRRHATALGTHRSNVHVQAVRRHRWLLKTTHGTGRFRMRPDVLIERRKGQTRFILDTKWKRLKRDAEDPKNGVAQADMYQLFAYAHRYLSADNVLLFPRVPGVTPKQYRLQDDELQRTIRVEFIDLNRDLAKATNDLVRELRGMLNSAEDAR